MAQYDNAKRILNNAEARIAQSAEGIYDENTVVMSWQNIEPRYINECVDYLNHLDQSLDPGPTQFYDFLFQDDLFHLHAYYNHEDQRIYRVMMRNAIVYDPALWTPEGGAVETNWALNYTKWKLFFGDQFQLGQTSVVLSLPNVSPADALAYVQEALPDVFTDAVYILRGVVLAGTWYSVKRTAEVDPKTGLYTVRWFLNTTNTQKVYYRYVERPGVIKGHYYLWDQTEALIENFIKYTYFTELGYEDEDYDPLHPQLKDPRISWAFTHEVVGRRIEYKRLTRGEDDHRFDAEFEITWVIRQDEVVVSTKIGDKTIMTKIAIANATQEQIESFIESRVFTADGRALYLQANNLIT